MTTAQRLEHIRSSPDCRFTKDFTFTPYAQSRGEDGFSGSLLMAESKANPTERYIIKHSNASDPANEFVYYKIAAACNALMPKIKLFDCSGDNDLSSFKTQYICGSRFVEQQIGHSFDEMLEKAVNPQNYFYNCALGTLLDQDDKLQFMLDKDNYLYHYDVAETFNMDGFSMKGYLNVSPDNPMWGVLYANSYENAGSRYWNMLISGTSWMEDLRKQHGDGCVQYLIHPFRKMREIPETYIDGIIATLDCFYPEHIGDYYRRFIHNARKVAKAALAKLEQSK